MERYTLHFDGACEPYNPGGNMGFGWHLVNSNTRFTAEGADAVPAHPGNTNNIAEYRALINGLQWVAENIGTNIVLAVYGDSQLVIRQMRLEWQINDGKPYSPFARQALALRIKFPNISFEWLPRELNTKADALSKGKLSVLHGQ